MATHNECQELEGSRYANLAATDACKDASPLANPWFSRKFLDTLAILDTAEGNTDSEVHIYIVDNSLTTSDLRP